MVDDRTSPSAGWRAVYAELGVDPDVEGQPRACPDCGRECDGPLGGAYECPVHGVVAASASSEAHADASSDADDFGEADRHGRAD
ncbi:hypothetical protein [Halorussus halobius]|uniref:hypothetical protein n=1 Tax=Halorussus halobius TaxID=1710537 RepID=UPI001092484C|nr:hypothetical protein [Halorussus halobius]